MECPYCEMELTIWDYYGLGIPGREDFRKIGDIFKCQNEECEACDSTFYTDEREELYEGFPC